MSDFSAPVVERGSATAEIPPELFEPILWHATQIDPQAPQHDTIAHIRSVAPLTLVSTYFAKYCRPRMYEFVVLANQKRLEGLLAILHSGCKPLKEYLTDFTRSITVRYSEIADTIWALRAVRVLIPTMRYVGAKHLPDLIIDTDGALLPGLVPGQTQLPCSLPPSIFQHVQQLDLRSLRFERGEDFLQCISILRNISAISLHGCHSATPVPSAALAQIASSCYANLRRVSGLVSDLNKGTCCASMLLQVLFFNGGRGSRSRFHPCVQSSAVVDLIQAIYYDSGTPKTRTVCAWDLTIEHEFLQIDSESNCRDAIGNVRLVAISQPLLQESHSRYNCVVRPLVDSSLEQPSGRTQVVCSALLERVVVLKYLRNIEFHFSQCEDMARFVEVTYHALRKTHTIVPRMTFKYDSPHDGSGCVTRHLSTPMTPVDDDTKMLMKTRRALYDISMLWWKAGPHEIQFADMHVFIKRLEELGKGDNCNDIIHIRTAFAGTPCLTQPVIGAGIDQLLDVCRQGRRFCEVGSTVRFGCEGRAFHSSHYRNAFHLSHPQLCGAGFVIPQNVYSAPHSYGGTTVETLGYATSYIHGPGPTITFSDTSIGMVGLSVFKALQKDFFGMADGDTRPRTTFDGSKIGIRILWPGHEMWTDHMNAVESVAGETQHITKGRLAHEVAKKIRDFHRDMSGVQSTDIDPSWWLGGIPLDQLVLVELRYVPPDSWQPVIIWRV